jgi:hypothetical protein
MMSNKMMIDNNLEAAKERVNGHANGQPRVEPLSEDDLEEQTGDQENTQMNWELLRQFRKHGVTVAFPVNFADAISPQRGQSGKDKEQPPARSNGHVA